jgi:hypothetical protein
MDNDKKHLGKYQYGGHATAEAEASYREAAQRNKLRTEEFSEARVNLMREIRHHPELNDMLAESPKQTWEEQLADIAAYCGTIVDGVYLPFELEIMYKRFYEHLRGERSGVVLANKHITFM